MQNLIKLQDLYKRFERKLQKPEEKEQIQFVLRLESKGYMYFAIPNSTYTKSILQRVRNMLMWVVSWPPDLCIVLKRKVLLFIEMKKLKWWVVSLNQKKWIKILNDTKEIEAYVCNWFKEAKGKIEEIENK